jgi:hypothetical protein
VAENPVGDGEFVTQFGGYLGHGCFLFRLGARPGAKQCRNGRGNAIPPRLRGGKTRLDIVSSHDVA